MSWNKSLPRGYLCSDLTQIFGYRANPESCWSQTSQSCGRLEPPGCEGPSRSWNLATGGRNVTQYQLPQTNKHTGSSNSDLLWSPDTCQRTTWTPLPGHAPSPAPQSPSALSGPGEEEKWVNLPWINPCRERTIYNIPTPFYPRHLACSLSEFYRRWAPAEWGQCFLQASAGWKEQWAGDQEENPFCFCSPWASNATPEHWDNTTRCSEATTTGGNQRLDGIYARFIQTQLQSKERQYL